MASAVYSILEHNFETFLVIRDVSMVVKCSNDSYDLDMLAQKLVTTNSVHYKENEDMVRISEKTTHRQKIKKIYRS